jgi:tetratricopeptide (TPR) repeat protein
LAAAKKALALKPDSALAYNNIGAAYAALAQWDLAQESERAALRVQPGLEIAKNNLAFYERQKAAGAGRPGDKSTAEDWLNASLKDSLAGEYEKSIDDAKEALRLRPGYAEAYNNIAFGYASLGKWDEAIGAAEETVRLKPDFQLAKNNLAWARTEKAKARR